MPPLYSVHVSRSTALDRAHITGHTRTRSRVTRAAAFARSRSFMKYNLEDVGKIPSTITMMAGGSVRVFLLLISCIKF